MNEGRDEHGRFAKGNGGGPGRKPRATEVEYLDIMLSIVTPAHWRKIITKAVKQAEMGNPVARKWLADYIIGSPVERKELTGSDGGPVVIQVIDDDYPNQLTDIAPGPG